MTPVVAYRVWPSRETTLFTGDLGPLMLPSISGAVAVLLCCALTFLRQRRTGKGKPRVKRDEAVSGPGAKLAAVVPDEVTPLQLRGMSHVSESLEDRDNSRIT